MVKIKKLYLHFLEKEDKSKGEKIIYYFLLLLSFIYSMIMKARNFLYDKEKIKSYRFSKKIISIGGLSWAGAGKTGLVIYLHKRLSPEFKVASITKGYAEDELLLLREKVGKVFDSKDRVRLIKKLESNFDVFLLDDGFQYRKIKRDLDVVIMSKEELEMRKVLIPASVFREPLSSLKRADILVISYGEKEDILKVKEKILTINPYLKIYYGNYRFKRFLDRNKREVKREYFQGKKIAVLTAIGYPKGFLEMVKKQKVDIEEKIIYPDHYRFSKATMSKIEERLSKKNIRDVIITYKDFFHIDWGGCNLNYFILDVELEIEDGFLKVVRECLNS